MHAASPFVGTWKVVEAILPSGAFGYTGHIVIAQHGSVCLLDWKISAGTYVGVGMLHGEHLLVSCGEQLAGLGLALCSVEGSAISVRWCAGEAPYQSGTGRFTTPWLGTFEGEHELTLALPDGRHYGTWTLAARRTGAIFELTWRKGEQMHLRGIGLAVPGGLAAFWYPDAAQLAVMDYQLAPEDPGRLTAVWGLGGFTTLGTETLIRT